MTNKTIAFILIAILGILHAAGPLPMGVRAGVPLHFNAVYEPVPEGELWSARPPSTGIAGPDGQLLQRNEYDAQGRLAAVVDSDGNRTAISRDLSTRSETITGPDGNALTVHYDNRGNVTRQVDALGRVIFRKWDDAALFPPQRHGAT